MRTLLANQFVSIRRPKAGARENQMNKTITVLLALLLNVTSLMAAPPFMATGIKIGEVTASEAIVWVRLTQDAQRVDFGGPDAADFLQRCQNRRGARGI